MDRIGMHALATSAGRIAQGVSRRKAEEKFRPPQQQAIGGLDSIDFLPVRGTWRLEIDTACLRSQIDEVSAIKVDTFHVRICKVCSRELWQIFVSFGIPERLRAQVIGQGTSKTDSKAGEFLKIRLATTSNKELGTIVVPKSLLCPCGKIGKAVLGQFIKH
ncbi:MAG: hypothetical protein AAB507_01240 [Patescibacteria group bacterium]